MLVLLFIGTLWASHFPSLQNMVGVRGCGGDVSRTVYNLRFDPAPLSWMPGGRHKTIGSETKGRLLRKNRSQSISVFFCCFSEPQFARDVVKRAR